MVLDFRRIMASDLKVLQGWYEDAEMVRRMSYPSEEWFKYVTETDEAKCWIFTENNELVSQLQVDKDGDFGFIDLAVRPALRGQGIGARSLAIFLKEEGRHYSAIEAFVEPDNTASLICFQRSGFIFTDEVDEEGFVRGQFHPQPVRSLG